MMNRRGLILALVLGAGVAPQARAADALRPTDPGTLVVELSVPGPNAAAAEPPALVRATRAAGRARAPRRMPPGAGTIYFEVLDAAGEVVHRGSAPDPARGLEYVDAEGALGRLAVVGPAALTLSIPDRAGARRIALYRVTGMPDRDDPKRTTEALGWVELTEPPPAAAAAPAFPVTPIVVTGDPATRINIVYLAEGYTAPELADFIADVQATNAVLFSNPPYGAYTGLFNAYAVEVPSNESGADHPGTAGDEPGGLPTFFRDTYFDATYDYGGIHRLLVAQDPAAVFSVLAASFPDWDIAFVVVNHEYYGGSGGAYPTFSTHGSSAEIAIHELGHSFGTLADEYDSPGGSPYEAPNATAETVRALIRWNSWIAPTTPIPTPETTTYAAVVGLFEGAVYRPTGWYRPKLRCKMQMLGIAFCQVCAEQTVLRMYDRLDPIAAHDPPELALSVPTDEVRTFVVEPNVPPADREVRWSVDASPVGAGEASYEFDASLWALGPHTVEAVVRDATPLVRNDPLGQLEQSVTWSVEVTIPASVADAPFPLALAATPNPFTGATTIEYRLAAPGRVRLTIYDLSGRRVRVLEAGERNAGRHGVAWDGRDEARRAVAPGVYLLGLETAAAARTLRLVRVR